MRRSASLDTPYAIIGTSPLAEELRRMIAIAAMTDQPVLISGETGSGKEIVAKAIHFSSSRAMHPFVSIHCASLPKELAENEIFGGHFAGVESQRAVRGLKGKKIEAIGGTLFLDGVEELEPSLQSKLLRLFEEEKITTARSSIRIIASSKETIEKNIQSGQFRKDLFYRLNVIRIHTPPLRERKEDIPDLVQFFIAKYAKENPKRISKKALSLLYRYHWPGNVRELENMIIRLCLTQPKKTIEPMDIDLPLNHPLEVKEIQNLFNLPLPKALEELEQMFIHKALAECPTRSAAAKKLGIVRPLLYAKLRKYDIH
ncbi:AAA family ATPase [Methylacidiphilum sp. Yel]|uniref:sigma 54-interacting transcriptional regulator n=1 Tax=Methylacidiphilum sp. Yel TaxID=1847730 RepID=UPI00106AD10E|nr:sigma-54 dependent transcriptional regulator [Methylacidiphilum sp. Yel]TFE67340.1 AAA family ATPase [Methylacidiphilum sp. Yel]